MVDEVTTSSQAIGTESTLFHTCVGNEVALILLAHEDEVTMQQTLPVNVVNNNSASSVQYKTKYSGVQFQKKM